MRGGGAGSWRWCGRRRRSTRGRGRRGCRPRGTACRCRCPWTCHLRRRAWALRFAKKRRSAGWCSGVELTGEVCGDICGWLGIGRWRRKDERERLARSEKREGLGCNASGGRCTCLLIWWRRTTLAMEKRECVARGGVEWIRRRRVEEYYNF